MRKFSTEVKFFIVDFELKINSYPALGTAELITHLIIFLEDHEVVQ